MSLESVGTWDLEDVALDGLQHDGLLAVEAAEAMLEYLSFTACEIWVASMVGHRSVAVGLQRNTF